MQTYLLFRFSALIDSPHMLAKAESEEVRRKKAFKLKEG